MAVHLERHYGSIVNKREEGKRCRAWLQKETGVGTRGKSRGVKKEVKGRLKATVDWLRGQIGIAFGQTFNGVKISWAFSGIVKTEISNDHAWGGQLRLNEARKGELALRVTDQKGGAGQKDPPG